MNESIGDNGNPGEIDKTEKGIILKKFAQYAEGCLAENAAMKPDICIASEADNYKTRLCGDPKTWPEEYQCNIPDIAGEKVARLVLAREKQTILDTISRMTPHQLTRLLSSLRRFNPTDSRNFPTLKKDQLINCGQTYPATGGDADGIGKAECEARDAGHSVRLIAIIMDDSIMEISLRYCVGAAYSVPDRMTTACREYVVWKKPPVMEE